MRPLIICPAVFALGFLVASVDLVHHKVSSWLPLRPVDDLIYSTLRGGRSIARCYDLFAEYPLSPVMHLPSMTTIKHPIPGLAHITLVGRSHFNTERMEMWHETVAPGCGTPIHMHDCEEAFWIYQGSGGVIRMQDEDGTVVEQRIEENSTVVVPPNSRHQLWNEGSDSVKFVVAFDRPPLVPYVFSNWSDPVEAATLLFPLPWDAICPSEKPPSVRRGATKSTNQKSEL